MKLVNQRLTVLHSESSPSMGGQEMRILLEMEALAGRGIDSILVARPETPILLEAQRRGLTAYGVPMRSNVDLLSMGTIFRLMKKHAVDVVNAHNSKDAWNVSLVARLLGKPVIRARHIANPVKGGGLRKMIYGPMCDAIMTTGTGIRDAMIEAGIDPKKFHVVPTGIDMARFVDAQPGSLRADLGIPADAPLVAQIAVIRSDKGPDIFIKAARQLIRDGCPAWFVLVGDGRARPRTEAFLAEDDCGGRIKMAGFRRDIPQILADIDLYVLAARSPEGVPQSILQAHAARVPVVATLVNGVREVAIDGQTALCAPRNDPDTLAMHIASLLGDPQRARQLAENGHQLVATNYTLDIMLQRMEALYRQFR